MRDEVAALDLEHAGKDLDFVGLVPLRGVARLAGGAAVEVAAELFRCQGEAGRTAVDDAADRRAMALAEGRDGEYLAERITRHVLDSETPKKDQKIKRSPRRHEDHEEEDNFRSGEIRDKKTVAQMTQMLLLPTSFSVFSFVAFPSCSSCLRGCLFCLCS